jgi:hypothetical protein
LADLGELKKWFEKFEIPLEKESAKAFEKYYQTRHAVFGTLVNHPHVPDAVRWSACNIQLQRAVIFHDGKRETLLFRSYFHSAKDEKNYVNFVPNRAVESSFESPSVFFPLALTKFISTPQAHVVLDIITEKAVKFGNMPKQLEVSGSGRMGGQERHHITRVEGVLRSGEDVEDMHLSF